MSLINSTLQTATLRFRDITGNVTMQKVHSRIFDAYEAKSLVLEALSVAQQHALLQFGGKVPPQHPSGPPVVLDNWADLMQLHKDSNLYQLLPRRAKTNSAYQVMRAVCSSTGSPFAMEDRFDSLELKFVFRAADQEAKQAFNNKNAEKVGGAVWFDGILKTSSDVALIMAHPVASPAHVNQLCGTVQFLREWSVGDPDGDRHKQMKQAWKDVLQRRTHLIIGTGQIPARDMVTFARGKGVHLYARKGQEFTFQPYAP
jgi:hypothetical protein